MNEEDLNNLKYRQLQKLAKEHGIKANLPKNAIIAAILEANSTENDIVETSEKIDVSKNDSVDSVDSLSSIANETTKNESKEESEEKVIEAVEDEKSKPDIDNEPKEEISQDDAKEDSNEKEVESSMQVDQEIKEPKNSLDSLPASRRNSRISRLFDKEAFDIEAAKVTRFAEKILNSPRRRSSILNLTPLSKGQTASNISSPLVDHTPKVEQKSINKLGSVDSPLAKPTPKVEELKKSLVNSSINRKSTSKPKPSLHRTVTKPTTKKVTMKANLVGTQGSITKAKDRPVTTGIPRPRKVPDFAKMHAKQFGNMDPLDQYMSKKKERMAALTPGAKKKPVTEPTRKSPRHLNVVTDLAKANFNFSPKIKNPTKPFVFNAKKTEKALDNITNKSEPAKFKPKMGKINPWNPKHSQLEKQKERQKMANRALGGEDAKKKQLSHIKGVRMNKRMELMLQKRKLNAQ